MKKRIGWLILILGCLLPGACDDLEDKPLIAGEEVGSVEDYGTAELYVLCEGLFNLNNSTLARYSFRSGSLTTDYFRMLNRRGLGDTANDMDVYGDKLYIVVNVSSTVEVVNLHTGLSEGQISLLADNGSARQPRAVAFAGGKAYVCSFDGTVARIDTASLQVEALARAGRNPEDLCAKDGKLYVSNSGGLDWEGIGVDRTVSVIDLETFTEVKQIEVGPNPGKIAAGPGHTVWVATQGEEIEKGDYHLVEIDTQNDVVATVYDEPVMDFAIDYNVAYLYNYDYQTGESAVKVFELTSGTVVREQFVTDGTSVQRPYSITVNPYSSNVYITEAYNYQVEGDLLCFSPEGKLLFRLNGIGLNPNTVIFRDKVASTDSSGTSGDTDDTVAFADKVWEYVPAPSQHMNTITTAYQEGFTADDVLALATQRLQSRSLLSLGAYGGYIVVGFSRPVSNVEGEYDLKIHGNAYYNATGTWQDRPGGSSEPGIVWVSEDENGNGLPDDAWYELAGSEYGTDTETRDYEITYYRPEPADADVRWTDNQGNEGYVYRNAYHTQASYYPLWVSGDRMTFRGTRLKDNAVDENGIWVGYAYGWGYADNHPNNTEMSQFKLEWAVDADGNPVQIDEIDFVKIYTAVNQYAGQVGEISTEIAGVENLHANQ